MAGITMPSFSDVATALTLPGCCMRKNPSSKDQLKDDLKMLCVTFGLYLTSYWIGYHSLCILSAITMDVIAFQAGMTFHEIYSKPIHLNQFDELDNSMDTDTVNEDDSLSLKQREQGATSSNSLTEEQEEKLNEQFKQVVEETNLRNRKRTGMTIARTPSSSTLVEDGEISPRPRYEHNEYKDMPPLISLDTKIYKSDALSMAWSEVPNFSQTHYLHNYMEELD